jgi:Tfp pilus assembly protein FimV
MAQPGMAEGMSELYKQASKLDGVPVLQITRMGAVAEGQDLSSVPSQTEDGAEGQVPSAGNVAGQAAGQAAAGAATSRLGRAGALGGALGGFGGFGRRKKQQQEEQAPPPQTQAEQQQAGPAAGQPALLMEMTSELTSFSSASVDAASFEVPAGFKQVENEMVKRMK